MFATRSVSFGLSQVSDLSEINNSISFALVLPGIELVFCIRGSYHDTFSISAEKIVKNKPLI